MAGIPGIHKLVDDVLLVKRIMKQPLTRVLQVFEACLTNSITLLASKAQIGTSVKFAGFIVDQKATGQTQSKVKLSKTFQHQRPEQS